MGVHHVVDLDASRRCTVRPSAPTAGAPLRLLYKMWTEHAEKIQRAWVDQLLYGNGYYLVPRSRSPLESTRLERRTKAQATPKEQPQKQWLPGQAPSDRNAWTRLNKHKKWA